MISSNDVYINELKKQYATVRPLCIDCKKNGKEAKTRDPSNMATNKAKRRKLNNTLSLCLCTMVLIIVFITVNVFAVLFCVKLLVLYFLVYMD